MFRLKSPEAASFSCLPTQDVKIVIPNTFRQNAIKIKTGGAIWGVNVGARYAITRTFAVSAFVGYQGIFMGSVERKFEGILANNGPLLLHNLKAGVGFNF